MYELIGCDDKLLFPARGMALYDEDNEYALKAIEDFAYLFVNGYDIGMTNVPQILITARLKAPDTVGQRMRYMDIWHKWGLPSRPRSDKAVHGAAGSRYSVWVEGLPHVYPYNIQLGNFGDDENAVEWMLRVAEFYAQQHLHCGLIYPPAGFVVRDGVEGRRVAMRKFKDALAEVKWFDINYDVLPQPPCPVEHHMDCFKRYLMEKDEREAREREERANDPKNKTYEQMSLF